MHGSALGVGFQDINSEIGSSITLLIYTKIIDLHTDK